MPGKVMTVDERREELSKLKKNLDSYAKGSAPSKKELKSFLQQKDSLNPQPGKHHANRVVSLGQIKGDVERLIDSLPPQ